jgi:NAD(P)-dependent dehydrogenase (short-subunit alcohol dehydrogenase family)
VNTVSEVNDGNPVQLVIGATGGIGSATVRLLREAGSEVVIASRNGSRVQALAEEVGGTPLELDATDPHAVEEALRSAVNRHGRLDGVVNCVGSLLLKPAHLTSPEEWAGTIDVNLGSAFAVVRAAGRVMTGGGAVVLISSAAARVGLSNHEAIAAAKAGVIGLTLSAAATYSSRGLRVNAVAPGLVRTPMTERITANASAAKASTALHALGRLGEPADVAHMIAWLLDPRQSWITGQVFGVDGGLATVRSR